MSNKGYINILTGLMAKKFLIVGPAWIGDMVLAQSLFIFLKQQDPQCQIDVITPVWSQVVLERMPEVTTIIVLDIKHGSLKLWQRIRLGLKLRKNNYSKCIVIPRSWKSALTPYFANIPKRCGYRGEMRYFLLNDIRPLDKSKLIPTVQKTLALGLAKAGVEIANIPLPKLKVDLDCQNNLLQKFNLKTNNIIALMPGAEYGKAKQWPLEYFSEVASKLKKRNYLVVVLGSKKDNLAGEQIAKSSGAINLCGKTTINESIDLLATCKTVITNDSGLMHIAAAVKSKVIAIYGSSSPNYTPPMTNNKQIHYLNLSCSPCFARTCKFETYDCLRKIRPQDVLASC